MTSLTLNRRTLVSLMALTPALPAQLWAAPPEAKPHEYRLTIARQIVNITGKPHRKITVNGTIPGPVLHFTEGDEAIIHVTNGLEEDTSVHWHGLLVPPVMDGAPGFNGFNGIRPGETFTYRIPLRQSGTYWYHAHSMGQEQDGLYGALVIAPRVPEPVATERDYVVLLSDYSREDASEILANLKRSSEHYQYHRRTVFDLWADVRRDGISKALSNAADWGKMRMLPTDLSDVTGYAFLMNGLTPDRNWTGLYTPGERIRLRFINASAMTIHDLRIPGLKLTLVAADGRAITPIEIDELRFGNAETYDVIVEPKDAGPYQIVAESLDREGFALGTLSATSGAALPPPAHRPRAQLSMADMNMAMMMADDPDMDMSDPYMHISGWAQTGAPEGMRTLSYADLKPLTPQTDTRAPTRDITVRLGGNMERYVWTINGRTFDSKDGIPAAFDERLRLSFVNETMMAHPIHLHGLYMQLESGEDATAFADKHTIIIPPGQTVSALITANEPGDWPLHCHLLYHMSAGMMTTFRIGKPGEAINVPATQPAHNGGHHDHN